MIRFGTGGWREIIGDGFIRENIQRIATALAMRMEREGCAGEGICIGYDRRFLSKEACKWFSEAAAAHGVHVRFVNVSCPTPQIMFAVRHLNLPYGAMVTASHNLAIYNGIKLFTRGGRDAVEGVTREIQDEANALRAEDARSVPFDRALASGAIEIYDPRDEYLDAILAQVDMGAIRRRRLRVVLDPMYGVGRTGLMTILYSARCDVEVIHGEHDAFFGRRLPAPTPETLHELQRMVLFKHADLGIATDGDADRLGIIDETGRYVSANQILSLLYNYLLSVKGWRGAAVRNIATTHLLDRIAKAYGQECIEVPVGFKHISKGMEDHDAIIGGESSGGLTVKGHIPGKDGLYAASLLVEMIAATGKSMGELVRELSEKYGELHSAEYDWDLTQEKKDEIKRVVMDERRLPDFGVKPREVSYRDGCKVYFDGAWAIVRFSGTEPRVRIFAEDASEERARDLVRRLAEFIDLPFEG